MTPLHYPRHTRMAIQTALEDTRVVMLVGPRQCGKTTLVREFDDEGRTYATLEDPTIWDAASSDPVGFVRRLGRGTIDEVQLVPELLRVIKLAVDEDPTPGRFLITGSADILDLPDVNESLAGRSETIELLPLSPLEIAGRRPRFLDVAFDGDLSGLDTVAPDEDIAERVVAGGYPEALRALNPVRRASWHREYVSRVVHRDLPGLMEIQRPDSLHDLLRHLAFRTSQLTESTTAGAEVGIDRRTVDRYMTALRRVFLLDELPAWGRNQGNAFTRSPKVHLLDSGVAATLQGMTTERLAVDRTPLGPLLESWVYAELRRQCSWARDRWLQLFHFRDRRKNEVDFVIQNERGQLVGVEVKAAASVRDRDLKGLRALRGAAGDALVTGMVLYDGAEVRPLAEGFWAIPHSALWS